MEKIDTSLREFRELDEISSGSSIVHKLNPVVKFICTIFYILIVVSFGKYQVSRLVIMVLYPFLLFELGGISFKGFLHKLRFVLPLVCAVGIINPFVDTTPLFTLGGISVSGGIISFITLMIKGLLCLMASYLLVASTPFNSLCAALRRMHVPAILVSLLMLTYRYISLMMEEVSIMTTAYKLRAPGQKGIHFKAWGPFLGQLLLRSFDRAEEIYAAMQLRGFREEYPFAPQKKLCPADFIYAAGVIALCIVCKNYDLAALIGSLFLGGNA